MTKTEIESALSAAQVAYTVGLRGAMLNVLHFHQTFGHPIQTEPTIPSPERQVLRHKLIREEYHEFVDAWDKCAELRKETKLAEHRRDIPPALPLEALAELADALADMIYVINGCALEYGLPLDLVWDAVQTANMQKVWKEVDAMYLQLHNLIAKPCPGGYVVYDSKGKVQKPIGWQAPDILSIIKQAMEA